MAPAHQAPLPGGANLTLLLLVVVQTIPEVLGKDLGDDGPELAHLRIFRDGMERMPAQQQHVLFVLELV
jgi:hypothetical protein